MPPPPPSSRWHSHTQGVAHLCVTQSSDSSQLAHTMTKEMPQRHVAMPTVQVHTSATPSHVANGPRHPSTLLTRATATRPKRRPTVQHQHNGMKVRRPPPRSWGTRPLLLTPCIQGKPPCCAEACDADRMDRLGCDPPTTTTRTQRTMAMIRAH